MLAALALGFKLDASTPQLITVVLVGIGVDYFLFLLFRLRERLRAGEDRRTAARNAAGAVGPVIASAALAVVAAFATLGARRVRPVPDARPRDRDLGPRDAARRRHADARDRRGHRPRAVLAVALVGARAHQRSGRPPRAPDRPPARAAPRSPSSPCSIVLATFAARHEDVLRPRRRPARRPPPAPPTRSRPRSPTGATRSAARLRRSPPRGTLTAARSSRCARELADVDGVTAVGRPVLTPDRHGARIDVVLADAPITKAAMDVGQRPAPRRRPLRRARGTPRRWSAAPRRPTPT